jgi:hypothetical protein
MGIPEIFKLVVMENAKAKVKHGPWRGLDTQKQIDAIFAEYGEWTSAFIEDDKRQVTGEISVNHTVGGIIDAVMGRTAPLVVLDAEAEEVQMIGAGPGQL